MPGRLRAAGRRPGRDTVTSPVVVVMGVSGCGKSTVGAALARALGIEFVEGDAFHPPENVARMAAGTPLTDEDRAGWLRTLAAHIAQAAPRGVVVSCSALKRSYRDVLRTGSAALRFVWLDLPRAELEARMARRTGHYMPASLLASQLATLEPPSPDEGAIRLDGTLAPDTLVAAALARLGAAPPSGNRS
jgi:carbohydrate kinase (thermoresistant glucokinase family)